MVVFGIAAFYGNVVSLGIVNTVKQQNGVAHHFEAGHARKSLVEVISFDCAAAVCKRKLVFACDLCGQIVFVSRCSRCAEGLLDGSSVGFGDGKFCRFRNACPHNARACDVHGAESRSVGLPQSKQCGVGGKTTTVGVLTGKFVGLVVSAYPPALEGVAFASGYGCAVDQLAAYGALRSNCFGCIVAEIERNGIFRRTLNIFDPLGIQRNVGGYFFRLEIKRFAAEVCRFVPGNKFVAGIDRIRRFCNKITVGNFNCGCACSVVKRYCKFDLLVQSVFRSTDCQNKYVALQSTGCRTILGFVECQSNYFVFRFVRTRRKISVHGKGEIARAVERKIYFIDGVNALFRAFFSRRGDIIVAFVACKKRACHKTARE